MGERELDSRLEELRAKNIPIYSISRLDTINNCLYEAYRTYKLGDRGANNIYGVLGGTIHETLEDIVNGKATEDDLLPAMQNELDNLEMFGISFPKDSRGGDSIRDGWVKNIEHFCKTYKSPRDNLTTEELFIYTTSEGHVLQGYIDLQEKNSDDTISIYDYKTSSMYTKAGMDEHARQLIVYQMGKEQEGAEVKSVAWIFLKYVEVKFLGKKTAKSKSKTEMSKVVERRKIAQEMSKYVEQDLYELGYDEIDSEVLLNEFVQSNSFQCLPDEIKNNYTVVPYICYYPVGDEEKQACEDYINTTINMWESLGDDVSNYPPREFTKTQKNGKVVDDIFYCTNLCGHFKNCPYIQEYLDKRSVSEEDDDLADLF